MRLFVIGNGFDLAHDMKTQYSDFRDYLEDNEQEFLVNFEIAYGFHPVDEDDPYTPSRNTDIVKKILWKDFENNLYNIEAENIIDNISAMDLGLESGNIGVLDTMDEYLESEYSYIKSLNEYVADWVKTVDMPNKKKTVLIDKECEDMYLNFNYTPVLEELYEVDSNKILHVHGSIVGEDIEPIMGHGNKGLIRDARQNSFEASERFDEMAQSAYTAVANYYENTLKDVDSYLYANLYFFNKLAHVNEIYIIGHSLGEVDIPYYEKINAVTNRHTKWFVFYYDENDKGIFCKKLLKLDVSKNQVEMKPFSEFYI